MSRAPETLLPPPELRGLRPLPQLIFSSRWLQLPLYLGLIVAQADRLSQPIYQTKHH